MTGAEWNTICEWLDARYKDNWTMEEEDALLSDLAGFTASSVKSCAEILYRRNDGKGWRFAASALTALVDEVGTVEAALPAPRCAHPVTITVHDPAEWWVPTPEVLAIMERTVPEAAEQHARLGKVLKRGTRTCADCGEELECECPHCGALSAQALVEAPV